MENNNNEPPKREELIKHNREYRLAKGWAHQCPKEGCNRQFTTFNALKNHCFEKHKINVVRE